MLPSVIQQALSQQDFAAVETDWLARIGENREDVAYFAAVAKALVDLGQDELCRVLLELLDGELKDGECWNTRLELLRRAASLITEPADLHEAVLETLRQNYAAKPNLEELMDIVGLHRGTPGEPKMWSKVARLESLVVFDLGAIVTMQGKGVGRVVEVNLALESFKVDFERHNGVNVGFRVAGKLLEPLTRGHVLRRKLEEPDELRSLRDTDAAELLRITLTSYDRPLTGGEVREALAGVVSEDRWTSWWSSARKHRQVVTVSGARQSGGRQTYQWAESTEDADSVLWQAFEASDPRGKLECVRRATERDPKLYQRMVTELAELIWAVASEEPGLAFELWVGLEKTGQLPPDTTWSPVEWISGVKDIASLFTGLQSRAAREKAYALVREVRADWHTTYRRALAVEEDPRLLDQVTTILFEEAPPEYEQFFTETLSQPRKSPGAFTWLAEKAADNEDWRKKRGFRFLQQILAALANDDFAAYRSRLTRLCDSGGTVPRLLSHLTENQAGDALRLVARSGGLEEYQREPLKNALVLRFPALQESGEAPLYATVASLQAKQKELRDLLEVEIPANRRAIEEARAMGDLRENFEYKSARQRHEYLSARASQLDEDLSRAEVLDPSVIDPSEIRVGTRVHLDSSAGRQQRITILGPWESQPENGIVSYESELAQELLGKKPGEAVEISGESFEVKSIEVYRR